MIIIRGTDMEMASLLTQQNNSNVSRTEKNNTKGNDNTVWKCDVKVIVLVFKKLNCKLHKFQITCRAYPSTELMTHSTKMTQDKQGF